MNTLTRLRQLTGETNFFRAVYWLVQLARQSGCKLATLDAGTLANWPADTLRIP